MTLYPYNIALNPNPIAPLALRFAALAAAAPQVPQTAPALAGITARPALTADVFQPAAPAPAARNPFAELPRFGARKADWEELFLRDWAIYYP